MNSHETSPSAALPDHAPFEDGRFRNGGTISLSIVVPTYHREAYLPALFEALLQQAQTVACPVEVVLVDNSTEGSALEVPHPPVVRSVHEPRPGVAQARNRGVAEARGSHVIFLDDDELPEPGWLEAFAAMAAGGGEACFGSIVPDFERLPPDALRAPLERVFSRDLPAVAGADVTAMRAYLGSGNSMFARAVLSQVSPPFDVAFNAGGEDVWLLRQLAEDHGVHLLWCPAAKVRELVPASRISMGFLARRRFSDGQLRCLVESGAGGAKGAGRTALWMGIGAAQLLLGGLGSLVAQPLSPARSARLRLMAAGGRGKLMWWQRKAAMKG